MLKSLEACQLIGFVLAELNTLCLMLLMLLLQRCL